MIRRKPAGRKAPYTIRGIRRVPCVHCGQPSHSSWRSCADNHVYRPVCWECDLLINRYVLAFMRMPKREIERKMRTYVRENRP